MPISALVSPMLLTRALQYFIDSLRMDNENLQTGVELTTAATRGYPDWSVVCCVETVGQSKTRQQVGSTFYLNHSAAGQSAAQKTTHVF